MKKLLMLLSILPSILLADINWAEDYESGLAKAKKEHKKVMLMFSREECHVCQMMKEKVYTNKKVEEYINNNFIPIEAVVDFDGKLGYKVYGTPTYYFLTPEGKQIGDMKLGGSTVEGFLKLLHKVNESK